MFEKVSTDLDFVAREQQIIDFWKENDIFKKSIDQREGGDVFTFYDGPPTANGKPHIGHILTRAMKDLIPRYQTMKGKKVLRKAGWDTHGLPVELEVEKLLGLDGKEQIEQYGIEAFIKECKKSVWKYKGEWEKMSDRVGYWADMDNPYITYDNNYIESVWWSLKQVADKGLLYHGHKVVPYCPRCGTALSSHEVGQGYKSVTETSAFVRFLVKGTENTYLYAWTTTPWTLPSNVALCVNPNETYAKFDYNGETVIMAQALIASVLGADAEISNLTTMPGRELEGMEYEPLFDFVKPLVNKKCWFVICDNYVTMSDGTGIVHQAPAFGEDDYRVCTKNNTPFLQLVDTKGCMSKETPWAGTFVKDADPVILKELKEAGKLVKGQKFTHDYPFCWRCDTPLIYYARATWFIRMTAMRDQLTASNRAVNWMPEHIRDGRMGNFVENVIDWGLSRERYWGTPLPVWICKDCGETHVIGSIAELKELGKNVPENIELHRPYIDDVHLTCPKCGGDMARTKEVIDCWYDSGSMPFAQWHYPFENKEIFEENFPADFISEAQDQTRGWFYTLMAIGTLVFGRAPYENVVVLGHVRDKNGIKMSKHKGNVVDPWDVLNVQGADAVRWYFYTAGAPWESTNFAGDLVSEVQRKYMGTVWNTYAFFTLYASIDNYDPNVKAKPEDFTLMDKWALSKLNSLVKFVDEGLAKYKITETSRALAAFADEISNWYVRRSRERFWQKDMPGDKLAAYETLYTVLTTLSALTAPFTPFMAESIYRNLVVNNIPGAAESVHLLDFPVCDETKIDKALESGMEEVIEAVQLGRACRAGANLKVRQPLAVMYVKGRNLPDDMAQLIADELNVKSIRFVDDARAFTTYKLKPQMRTLGPKYGKLLGQIGKALQTMDGNDVVDTFARGEQVKFDLNGTEIVLDEGDVLTESTHKEGFVAETDHGITVVLDSNLTDELIREGYIREVISKIQTMRKEADFEVTDRVEVRYQADEKLSAIIEAGKEDIMTGTLTILLEAAPAKEGDVTREWSINGSNATLSVCVHKEA